MKRIITAFGILCLSLNLSAQYKKASVFGKIGRTYEFGPQINMFGNGMGNPLGFKAGMGIDRDGKRLFTNWAFQYIPSYKYSYSTTDYNDAPVDVSGKAKGVLTYSFSVSYHLLKNDESEKSVLQPFVSAAINAILSGGPKTLTVSPDSDPYYLKKQIPESNFGGGIGGGVGCLVNFSSLLGLKLQGGYNYQFHSVADRSGAEQTYYLTPSHPYVSVGLRIRIATEVPQ
jgi:hypothetical protein